jgi:hypothetical protein
VIYNTVRLLAILAGCCGVDAISRKKGNKIYGNGKKERKKHKK